MTTSSSIPNPTVPIIGPDGRLSAVWYQWFVTLFRRTGNLLGGSLSDVTAEASSGVPGPDLSRLEALAQTLEAGVPQPDLAPLYGLIYAVEAMAAQAMATGPLQARIAELEAQLLAGGSIPAAVLMEGWPIGDIQRNTGKFTSLNASGSVLLDSTGPQITFNSGGPVVSSPDPATLAVSTNVQANGAVTGTSLKSTGDLAIAPTTTTTAPAAGGAGALPATPAGYATVTINGTARKIPYY